MPRSRSCEETIPGCCCGLASAPNIRWSETNTNVTCKRMSTRLRAYLSLRLINPKFRLGDRIALTTTSSHCCAVALLVFLARTARTWIVAADFRFAADHGFDFAGYFAPGRV